MRWLNALARVATFLSLTRRPILRNTVEENGCLFMLPIEIVFLLLDASTFTAISALRRTSTGFSALVCTWKNTHADFAAWFYFATPREVANRQILDRAVLIPWPRSKLDRETISLLVKPPFSTKPIPRNHIYDHLPSLRDLPDVAGLFKDLYTPLLVAWIREYRESRRCNLDIVKLADGAMSSCLNKTGKLFNGVTTAYISLFIPYSYDREDYQRSAYPTQGKYSLVVKYAPIANKELKLSFTWYSTLENIDKLLSSLRHSTDCIQERLVGPHSDGRFPGMAEPPHPQTICFGSDFRVHATIQK